MKKLQNIYQSHLSEMDRQILNQAEKILLGVQLELGKQKSTQSLTDGDIVCGEEIARVRGILSHYADNEFFRVVDI